MSYLHTALGISTTSAGTTGHAAAGWSHNTCSMSPILLLLLLSPVSFLFSSSVVLLTPCLFLFLPLLAVDDWGEPHVGKFAHDTAPCPTPADPLPDQNEATPVRLRIAGLPRNVDASAVASRIAPFAEEIKGDAEIVIRQPEKPDFAYVDAIMSPNQLKRCQTAYNKATWKGSKLSIQIAKRTYMNIL